MSDDLKLDIDFLYEVLTTLKTKEDYEKFLPDLCTYKEIESMAQRVKAASLLLNGATYEKIIRETNISSATLSRVSRCVKYGKGYKNYLKKS